MARPLLLDGEELRRPGKSPAITFHWSRDHDPIVANGGCRSSRDTSRVGGAGCGWLWPKQGSWQRWPGRRNGDGGFQCWRRRGGQRHRWSGRRRGRGGRARRWGRRQRGTELSGDAAGGWFFLRGGESGTRPARTAPRPVAEWALRPAGDLPAGHRRAGGGGDPVHRQCDLCLSYGGREWWRWRGRRGIGRRRKRCRHARAVAPATEHVTPASGRRRSPRPACRASP